MTTHPLDQVQRLVDELSPLEQAQLLEHLSVRIARTIAARHDWSTPRPSADYQRAWEEFFRQGDALVASDIPGTTTLTQALVSMRR